MKYMGSKRLMLRNGLGKLISRQCVLFDRFVDLFSGTGSVSWFVAENFPTPVMAVDLQLYSTILAEAVISRTYTIDANEVFNSWVTNAVIERDASFLWKKSQSLMNEGYHTKELVRKARELCTVQSSVGAIWNAYGGHYFSPAQALTLDYLLNSLPGDQIIRTVCLAACIDVASECAAAPGHTAQPFQPTEGAGKYLLKSWRLDPIECCKKSLNDICGKHAKVEGKGFTADAQSMIQYLNAGDLVFIDPPYSSVQYSRFYHVLETVARCEKYVSVSGVGRYPPIDVRPQSKFSNVGQSKFALYELLKGIAQKGSTIIFTFPSGASSNGLSGDEVISVASNWFSIVDKTTVEGHFSSLGGNNNNRRARSKSSEQILLLTPKI